MKHIRSPDKRKKLSHIPTSWRTEVFWLRGYLRAYEVFYNSVGLNATGIYWSIKKFK